MKSTARQDPQPTRMPARLRLERRCDLVQGLGPVKLQLVFGVAGGLVLRQLLEVWRVDASVLGFTRRFYSSKNVSDKPAITHLDADV